jgi:hypothetical protein
MSKLYPSEEISKEAFHDWKRHPVTQCLLNDLTKAYLEQLGDDLPESIERGIPIAYEREGARKMLDLLWQWVPDSVKREESSAD